MTPEAAGILDHIVILVPYSTLLDPPTWLTDAFTISPGGRHADGVTENRLVLFSDGVYLELIAFIPGKEAERKQHRWGNKREGTIIDWAITLRTEAELDTVRYRSKNHGAGFHFVQPFEGGRTRPDGVELKWVISTWSIAEPDDEDDPSGNHGTNPGEFMGGELPFWCIDRTPRDLRVPYKTAPEATNHPSGALGVAGLTVTIWDDSVSYMLKFTHDVAQGVEGRETQNNLTWEWVLRKPDEELGPSPAGVEKPLPWPKLSLTSSDDKELVKQRCVIDLRLLSKLKTGIIGGHLGDGLPYIEIELVSS